MKPISSPSRSSHLEESLAKDATQPLGIVSDKEHFYLGSCWAGARFRTGGAATAASRWPARCPRPGLRISVIVISPIGAS